jgi:hypothetical protein
MANGKWQRTNGKWQMAKGKMERNLWVVGGDGGWWILSAGSAILELHHDV